MPRTSISPAKPPGRVAGGKSACGAGAANPQRHIRGSRRSGMNNRLVQSGCRAASNATQRGRRQLRDKAQPLARYGYAPPIRRGSFAVRTNENNVTRPREQQTSPTSKDSPALETA